MIAARPIALAGLAAAASTYAQVPVGAPADVVAAVQACRVATGPAGVDEAKLVDGGWASGTASKNGKPVPMPFTILGKVGVKAIVMLPPASKLCVVSARIADAAAFDATAQALDAALATPRKAPPKEPNAALWFPLGHLVQLQPSGKADAPSVRVAVMSTSQENP